MMRRTVLALVALAVTFPIALLAVTSTSVGRWPTGFDRSILAREIPGPMVSAYLDAADTWNVDWALLAAIGKLECDHGRRREPGCWPPGTISPDGSRGPMQLDGTTWHTTTGRNELDISGPPALDGHGYATDGNHDGIADPWNPYDAVHSAARYLTDLGARSDPHTAARRYTAGPDNPDPTAGQAYADRAMQLVGEYRNRAGFGGPGTGLDLPAGTISPGCTLPDPTGTGGCVTPRTAQLVATLRTTHGPLPITCWAARPGNPTSDHPRGRACDITYGAIGRFPTPAERAQGRAMTDWLITHADALGVSYLIWEGRIWSPRSGWRIYTGGRIYDPRHPTGGHYDHIHISVRR
ncbi:MAG: lytic transglycosylase domain-containing protein, partial [Nitriliruptoraceae bacterium]